jgi:hypothetical protein
MSLDFYIDPKTGDLDLTNNIIRKTQSIEELCRQQVEIALRAFRGEWKFNILFGTPYLKNDNNGLQILGKVDKRIVDAEIKSVIVGREHIVKLLDYTSTLDMNTRQLSISFTASTESGEIIPFQDLPIEF